MTSRVSGAASSRLNVDIKRLALLGWTSVRIARELGLPKTTVDGRLTAMRLRGRLPSAKIRKHGTGPRRTEIARDYGRRLGSMPNLLVGLPDDVVLHVIRHTPVGGRLSETIAKMLLTAISDADI